jgi:hypothetical protein
MADSFTVSGAKRTDQQLNMWKPPPVPIQSSAQMRNHCGEFAEQLTAKVSGGERCKTDSRYEYCPDILHAADLYGECKSVGKSGHAIIYEGRREKDRALVASGRQLLYWFWHHRLMESHAIRDVDALRRGWVRALRFAVVLPFPQVDAIAETRRLKLLNSGYTGGGSELGYGNRSKGYGYGRTLLMSALKAACDVAVSVGPVDLCGVRVDPVWVYTVAPQRALLERAELWRLF